MSSRLETRRGASAALIAFLLVGAGAARAQPWPTEVLTDNGSSNRIIIAVLGDGYTTSEMNTLRSDARAMVDGLFAAAPFADYAMYFTAVLVLVESADSGIDHPETGTYRDTALDGAYNCGGTQRLICINYSEALTIAAQSVPLNTFAIAVVNDSEYGGSGGTVPVASTHADAIEIVRHEVAHPFADLADEYESPFPSYPACPVSTDCREPNVTLRDQRAQIKWLDWVNPTTPVPTPTNYTSVVGLFEGARYQPSGIYRPELNCKMRELGIPFCRVCSEALVFAIYDLVAPIDASSLPSTIPLAWDQSTTLTVALPAPPPTTLTTAWFVDGVEQVGHSGTSFVAHGTTVGPGAHLVRFEARDTTAAVRDAPAGLLDDYAEWSVTTNGWCGDGVPNGPEACDDGNVIDGDGCDSSCQRETSDGGPAGGDDSSGGGDPRKPLGPPEPPRITDPGGGCGCAGGGNPFALLGVLLAVLANRRRRAVA